MKFRIAAVSSATLFIPFCGGSLQYKTPGAPMKESEKKLLIATTNKGKLTELRQMMAALPITLLSLNEFPDAPEIQESGSTFRENAILKATGYALFASLPALADDSGLEVDALGGRPGVLSARY